MIARIVSFLDDYGELAFDSLVWFVWLNSMSGVSLLGFVILLLVGAVGPMRRGRVVSLLFGAVAVIILAALVQPLSVLIAETRNLGFVPMPPHTPWIEILPWKLPALLIWLALVLKLVRDYTARLGWGWARIAYLGWVLLAGGVAAYFVRINSWLYI